jgi:SAM-dependent methyltransferase
VLTPLLKGKRVLDLGCNIGLMPMLMLRAGASGVVGVELQEFNVETAQLIHDIFEWTDQKKYDLHVHHGNILDVLDRDFGRFDITTAYCSLYYVEADEMAKLVRRAAEQSEMMILQANIVPFPDPQKSARAQTDFLRQLLADNGFAEVEVHAPKDFQRPLLIGRKSESK